MTDIVIRKGETFSRILRWESAPFVYSAITAITKAAPVAITSTAHGLKAGWRAAVTGVQGMRQINSKSWPPRSSDFHKVTLTDENIITFNDVDSSNYTAYTSGGFLVSYTPVSLASFTARMQIRATADATDTLESLTSSAGITLDDTEHTVTITISATDTAAYDFTSGVYDLELVSDGGVVTRLLEGNVTVLPEVTR
jgi:hypothetical protein